MVPATVTGEEECFSAGHCEMRLSDPRVSGRNEPRRLGEVDVPNGFVAWGTATIRGPDGDWTGPWAVMAGSDFSKTSQMIKILEGTEAYEGWTFVVWVTTPPGWQRGQPTEVEGVIYRGSAPQLESPEPPPE
jgi:hypothetical protein